MLRPEADAAGLVLAFVVEAERVPARLGGRLVEPELRAEAPQLVASDAAAGALFLRSQHFKRRLLDIVYRDRENDSKRLRDSAN